MNRDERLTRLANRLVDQESARIIVEPLAPDSGYWFGGGNMIVGPEGELLLVGRYRNAGDSRTGVAAGERGLELAIFQSDDGGDTFHKVLSFAKSDLNCDTGEVLSIEGSAIRVDESGVELFVSTEKSGVGYPPGLESFLKPGAGVWSIDRLRATSIDGLKSAAIEPVLTSDDPEHLHVKDPFVHPQSSKLLFCTHPFCWTSSNTGCVEQRADSDVFDEIDTSFFPRGTTWDVAMTRGTAVVDLPQVGACADQPVSLMFYDGGECVRPLDEHAAAVRRPRGYSCEELGGAAYFMDGDLSTMARLSKHRAMFVSPHGTGCSRYVDVLATDENWYVTWQQGQADGSQPLVMHVVSAREVAELLGHG